MVDTIFFKNFWKSYIFQLASSAGSQLCQELACSIKHRDQNSSVCLDTRDASSWDQNPADTIPGPSSISALKNEFFTYTLFYIRHWLPRVLNSWKDLLRFSLCGSRQIPHLNAKPTRWWATLITPYLFFGSVYLLF